MFGATVDWPDFVGFFTITMVTNAMFVVAVARIRVQIVAALAPVRTGVVLREDWVPIEFIFTSLARFFVCMITFNPTIVLVGITNVFPIVLCV